MTDISSSQQAIRVPRKRLAELVNFVTVSESAYLRRVDLAVVGAEEMAELNRRYLRHAGATDVLSFDVSGPGEQGRVLQVIVCGPVAVAEAERRGLRPQHELMLYVIHGLLHQLGYDDADPQDAERMSARQVELLGQFRERCRRRLRRGKAGSRRPKRNRRGHG